jgi:hypothetical protein
MERDRRGCPVCAEPVDLSGLNGHCLMIDETGEFRYGHATCGLNHHTEGKKRRALVMCAQCGLPLIGDHADYSGQVITDPAAGEYVGHHVGGYAVCRDGGLFVRGPDAVRKAKAVEVPPPSRRTA